LASKWERQVERNAKKINAQRKRMGQASIYDRPAAGRDERINGRSWLMPAFLISVGLFYMISFWGVNRDGLYWFTVAMYLILAVVVFFFRKPFLSIGKSSLTTRKFAGFKTVQADDIEGIVVMSGYVIISMTNKKPKWVFSRLTNRYDTDYMAERLRDFADKNQVSYRIGE
jgi:hypothetical protein